MSAVKIKLVITGVATFALLAAGGFWLGALLGNIKNANLRSDVSEALIPTALAAKFEYLKSNGNSSCGGFFNDSISNLPDNERLRGSCCSPMNLHRYSEQMEGLKKYADIPEIPPDPYDIEARLAKKLKSYYDTELNPDEQREYDYAMENSDEKGPCCCQCWRWYAYGGLGKLLIQQYSFTGEQVTEVWNLSDGCGGAGDHLH